MSDGMSDARRMTQQAEYYWLYLEALKDYLEHKTEALFSHFMVCASKVSEEKRGWGNNRLLTIVHGHTYMDKLLSGDKEAWAALLYQAQSVRSEFTSTFQEFSPFRRQTLLFFRSDGLHYTELKMLYSRDVLLRTIGSCFPRTDGDQVVSYLVAFPEPEERSVSVVRAERKK